MNRYHATHHDPEIRKKYQEWLKASMHCKAVGSGHSSADAHTEAVKREKEQRKGIAKMLSIIGGQKIKGGQKASNAVARQSHKRSRMMQRTGGQRGS